MVTLPAPETEAWSDRLLRLVDGSHLTVGPLFRHRVERYGSIVDLYVDPDLRRLTIGRQLVDYCREWFESQNVSEFRISAPIANPATSRFLEALGGEPLSVLHVISLDRD